VEALPLVVLAIRRAADNKASAAANELAGAAKPFNRSFHLHPEDPPPSAMRRSAAQAMGKMKVKPNRFVEEWSSFRETPEERFAFTPTSVLTFAVFGIGLPCIIYRAVVYEEARSFRPSSCQTPFTFPPKNNAVCALCLAESEGPPARVARARIRLRASPLQAA
jgi:hypothetical protein